MNSSILKCCIITAIMLAGAIHSYCQNDNPDVFKQGTIPEQFKYLDEHTRIYENYRAIREDMYRDISRNTLDTLTKAKSRINRLILQATVLENRIDSLNMSLEATSDKLGAATNSKNSISVLGMEVKKNVYNTLMWTILMALVFLLVAGFLSFRRNRFITIHTKKDLEELKEEFEEYRKKVRLEREKTSLEHFNEIKKLKGGGPRR